MNEIKNKTEELCTLETHKVEREGDVNWTKLWKWNFVPKTFCPENSVSIETPRIYFRGAHCRFIYHGTTIV